MDFSTMKARTLDLIAEENNDRFDDTFVGFAVNTGCADFLDKTEAIDTHWTQTTEENQLWYLAPTNVFEIKRIEWYDASGTKRHKLEKKTMGEMDEEYPYDQNYASDEDWHQSTGDPEAWIPREIDVYGIWPACDVDDDTLYLYGSKKHVDMSDDANEPGFQAHYHHIPCIYAARMLLRSDNDEKAPSFEKWYEKEIMMAKKQIRERREQMPGQWRLYTY